MSRLLLFSRDILGLEFRGFTNPNLLGAPSSLIAMMMMMEEGPIPGSGKWEGPMWKKTWKRVDWNSRTWVLHKLEIDFDENEVKEVWRKARPPAPQDPPKPQDDSDDDDVEPDDLRLKVKAKPAAKMNPPPKNGKDKDKEKGKGKTDKKGKGKTDKGKDKEKDECNGRKKADDKEKKKHTDPKKKAKKS